MSDLDPFRLGEGIELPTADPFLRQRGPKGVFSLLLVRTACGLIESTGATEQGGLQYCHHHQAKVRFSLHPGMHDRFITRAEYHDSLAESRDIFADDVSIVVNIDLQGIFPFRKSPFAIPFSPC